MSEGRKAWIRGGVFLAVLVLSSSCSSGTGWPDKAVGTPPAALASGSGPAGAHTPASSAPTSPSPASRSTPTLRELYVDRITVYVCRHCEQVARRAGIDLDGILTRTIHRVASLLPFPTGSVSVDVKLGRIDLGHDISLLGFATGDDTTVNIPRNARLLSRPAEWVPTIAHELHHASRDTAGPGTTGNLLDRVVAEGSAVAFQEQAFPQYATDYWDRVLTPAEEAFAWRKMRPHLEDSVLERPQILAKWMLGGRDIPPLAGYVIGYQMVEAYVARHPGSTPAKLATVPSETILRGSGFST